MNAFDGKGIPYIDYNQLTGKLIVIEGNDGIGRSTQVELLKSWMESLGYAVMATGLTRSALVAEGITEAKTGHTLGTTTYNLYYATDFADLMENQMIPALRAGFIVLADRYLFTTVARAMVRGVDPKWIRQIYSFAIIPDLAFYLRVDTDILVKRVLAAKGLNYWESGMDLRLGADMYDSFLVYQSRLTAAFETMLDEYHLQVIDASRPVDQINDELKQKIVSALQLDVQSAAGA
jgi:dTMP kinase